MKHTIEAANTYETFSTLKVGDIFQGVITGAWYEKVADDKVLCLPSMSVQDGFLIDAPVIPAKSVKRIVEF